MEEKSNKNLEGMNSKSKLIQEKVNHELKLVVIASEAKAYLYQHHKIYILTSYEVTNGFHNSSTFKKLHIIP